MSRRGKHRLRQAVSLLEMLAVCIIVLFISGVALRAIVPAMQNRRIREAARIVNVFINSARNRAIQTGRPAGVWIDRFPGLPEAAVSLSYAQVPDPYGGDYINSGLEAFIYPDYNNTVQFGPPGPQYCLNVVVPSMQTMQGTIRGADMWSSATLGAQRFVRQGDLIRINYQNQYRLFSDNGTFPVPQGPYWIIGVGVNQNYLVSGATRVGPSGPFNSQMWSSRRYAIQFYNDLGEVVQPYITIGSSPTTYGRPVPYQIYRQPVKSAAQSVTLPEGTIIDLNYSGDTYKPFHPRNVASNPYIGTLAQPDDETPVIITFNPSGTVEQLYCRWFNQSNSAATAGEWVWRGDKPWNTIHFLVGQREKVPIDNPQTQTLAQQINYNWCDNKNIWVSIYPLSGLIITSPVWLSAVGTIPPTSGASSVSPGPDVHGAIGNTRSYANNPTVTTGGK